MTMANDTSMRRVLITDDVHPVMLQLFRSAGIEAVQQCVADAGRLLALVADYDGLVVRSKVAIDAAFVDRCGSRLRCIGRLGAGMDAIDVAYAEAHGIRCLNSPEGNRDAVGEHTVALLLALFDKVARADAQVRRGLWLREDNRGLELQGRTVGIIGFGNMGGAFARRLAGFDCRVLAYDLLGPAASGFGLALPYVEDASLDQLRDQAEVLSLHVPLTASTRHLVDASFLAAFRHDLFLVNTSRGAVVSTADLAAALLSGKVRGAALDVMEYENMANDGLALSSLPAPWRHLVQSDRTVLTPHVAGWTVESKYKLAAVLARKMAAVLLPDAVPQ